MGSCAVYQHIEKVKQQLPFLELNLRHTVAGFTIFDSNNPAMKKMIIFSSLLFAFVSVCAQNFEGTVRWTMKMDITDPKMKAEMDEAQKKMNDPATQAQMKEMEAQMNDPEMKKMMAADPQMKAQMEAMMKQSKGGGASSIMPSGMTMKIKGSDMVSVMEGGMTGTMEVLHAKDKPPVRIDRANKTFTTMPAGQEQGATQAPAKITKTSETTKLLGYNCTKYLAEVTERGTPMTQIFWTTTDIKDMDMKALARQRAGQGGQPLFHEQIEGVPLKMEFASPQGNMIMEVTEIKREKLNDSDFQIPADFKEVKMR